MKNKLKIIFFSLIPIIIIFKITYEKQINYLSLGDGLALGWTYYDKVGLGYSDYLYEYFKEKSKCNYIKTFSSKNKTIKDLREEIDKNISIISKGNKYYLKQSIKEANVITLSIGNNELSNLIKYYDSEKDIKYEINKIIIDLELLLKDIKKINNERIIMLGYYYYGKENNNIYIDYINKKMNAYCKKNNIFFIETNRFINSKINYLPNIVENYPSNEGYYKICKEIIKQADL